MLGFVNHPGVIPLQDNKHFVLSDVVGLAGGVVTTRGGNQAVAILRTTNGKPERLVVDMRKYFKTGNVKYNPEVKAGDVIFVPETTKPDWSTIFEALSSVAITYGQVIR